MGDPIVSRVASSRPSGVVSCRAELDGLLEIDVDDLAGRLLGVPVQQHADAPPQRAGHGHLPAAEHRHVDPAQLPRRQGRKLRVQVGGGRKNRAAHVFRPDAVPVDHLRQQLAGRLENLLAAVPGGGRGPADPSARLVLVICCWSTGYFGDSWRATHRAFWVVLVCPPSSMRGRSCRSLVCWAYACRFRCGTSARR